MDYNKNYYNILGVNKNASNEDIKKQFRILSKKYHPDTENGNENKFKEINEAYSILSDNNKKAEYDNRSPHGTSYSPFSAFSDNSFEFSFGGDIKDIFSQYFGGGFDPFGGFNPFSQFNRREEFVENLDINFTTTINFKQIYTNDDPTIRYNKFVHCDECKGTGFNKNGESCDCEVCNGTGINKNKTCEYCMGEGKIYSEQCTNCRGEKVVIKETEIKLQNIYQLRGSIKNVHRGYGHQSKYYRDKVGSLILNINVVGDSNYKIIKDYELHRTIDVHYQDAIQGNNIQYTHIDDTSLMIKLPEKTQNGNIIRVKEKGMLKNDNKRSDLFLKINIIIDYDRLNI